MYAPVVTRFATYGIELTGAARDYSEAVQALPSLRGLDAGRARGEPT